MISLIVAKAENGVIGSKNDLPWYLPADLKHFKQLTTGQTVVMGRKTFESILSRLGKPLPDRRNIVISRRADAVYEGVDVIHDIADIKQIRGDVYIIGGAEIYKATMDIADKMCVTEVKSEIEGDTYFPVIDPRQWREVSREPQKKDEKNQYDFDFVLYERSR